MVEKQDVLMYILAIKAFYHRIGFGNIVAIVDADLPGRDRELIRHHLGNVEFVHLESIDTGSCQRGGTWERVLYCVDRSADTYVVQIDADVLCFGAIDEVADCIRENRAFTLSEGLSIKPLADWAEDGISRKSDHIVNALEVRAKEFPDSSKVLYVRGSSGFAGFARGAVDRKLVEWFHAGGQKVHGSRWTEWGTEQIASNFAVANSRGSIPLPYPKYCTFEPEYATFQKNGIGPEISALHFIGIFRFDLGTFAALANREIDRMLNGSDPVYADPHKNAVIR